MPCDAVVSSGLEATHVSPNRDCGISVIMGGGGLLVKAIELKDRLNLILQTQLKPFVDCRHGMSPALVFSCCCITHTQF